MIALSCPHNFGVNISHLGFMNPTWAAMHDAGMGGAGDSIFWTGEFRHWGISREDVQFIPYWRNAHVVKECAQGSIVSLWKRPTSVALAVMNHGPDPEGQEQTRPARMRLDLPALGVPKGLRGEQLRVGELLNHLPNPRYLGHLKWVQDLPRNPRGEPLPLPAIQPKLDPRSGTIDGFDVPYHHVRYLALYWDAKPIADESWKDLFQGRLRTAVLDWGINTASALTGPDLADKVRCETGGIRIWAWTQPRSALLRITNSNDQPVAAALALDLDRLGIRVQKQWRDFTSIVALDGGAVQNLEEDVKPGDTRLAGNRGNVLYNGHTGRVWGRLAPGESRVVTIDRY